HLGDAAPGQPGVLAVQQGFKTLGKLFVAELAGPVTLQVPAQGPRQAGQNDAHQLLAHGLPRYQRSLTPWLAALPLTREIYLPLLLPNSTRPPKAWQKKPIFFCRLVGLRA